MRKADTDAKIDSLFDESSVGGEVNMQIVNSSSWDITTRIGASNRGLLVIELIVDELLQKRIPQLNAICDGLEVTGIQRLIQLYPKEMQPLFVFNEDLSVVTLIESIEKQPLHLLSDIKTRAYDMLVEYLAAASTEVRVKFLQFSTSLKRIPAGGISPKIEVNYHSSNERLYPEAQVCSSHLFIPVCHATFEEFQKAFNTALNLESEGFGVM